MIHEVKSVSAEVVSSDSGGFVAVASTPSLDRDGEVLASHCFDPLPASIPCHLDHQMAAAAVVARCRPYYVADELRIDARFSASLEAQAVRGKVAEGTLADISVVFRPIQWDQIRGIRTLAKGELLAADLVSVPSQRDARVLSVRSYAVQSRAGLHAEVERALVEAELAMAAVDLDAAERHVRSWSRPRRRQTVDEVIGEALRGGWPR